MKNLILGLTLLTTFATSLSAFEVESSQDIPVEEVTLTLTADKITNFEPATPRVGIPPIAVVHHPRIVLSKAVNLGGKDISQLPLQDDYPTRNYLCKAMGFTGVYYLWGFSNYTEKTGFYYRLPDAGAKLVLDNSGNGNHRLIDRISCSR